MVILLFVKSQARVQINLIVALVVIKSFLWLRRTQLLGWWAMKITDAIGITRVGLNVINADPEQSAHETRPAFKI